MAKNAFLMALGDSGVCMEPPSEHIVDSAYIDAELLVDSRQNHGISLIGPTRPNSSWQSKLENGYDIDKFSIDWEKQQVRCPEGKLSTSWREGAEYGGPQCQDHKVLKIRYYFDIKLYIRIDVTGSET